MQTLGQRLTIRHLIVVLGVLALTTSPTIHAQDNPFAKNAPQNPFATSATDKYVGKFSSAMVKLELRKNAGKLEGTLFYTSTKQSYPVVAEVSGDGVDGTFSAGGANFPFTFVLDQDATRGEFDTEGFNGTLVAADVSTVDTAPAANAAASSEQIEALFDEAYSLAQQVPSYARPRVIARIVGTKGYAGDIDGALALVAETSADRRQHGYAQSEIARAHAVAGNFSAAQSYANSIADPGARTLAIEHIAEQQAKVGDYSAALQTAAMSSGLGHVTALVRIGVAEHSNGSGSAAATMDLAKSLNDQISDPMTRGLARDRVVEGYATIGEVEKSLSLAKYYREFSSRSAASTKAAIAFAKAGNMQAYAEAIEQAREYRRGVHEQFNMNLYVAEYYGSDTHSTIAKLTQELKDSKNSTQGIYELALILLEEGKISDANNLRSRFSSHPYLPGYYDIALAKEYAIDGDLNSATMTARRIQDPEARASALSIVAAETARLN